MHPVIECARKVLKRVAEDERKYEAWRQQHAEGLGNLAADQLVAEADARHTEAEVV